MPEYELTIKKNRGNKVYKEIVSVPEYELPGMSKEMKDALSTQQNLDRYIKEWSYRK